MPSHCRVARAGAGSGGAGARTAPTELFPKARHASSHSARLSPPLPWPPRPAPCGTVQRHTYSEGGQWDGAGAGAVRRAHGRVVAGMAAWEQWTNTSGHTGVRSGAPSDGNACTGARLPEQDGPGPAGGGGKGHTGARDERNPRIRADERGGAGDGGATHPSMYSWKLRGPDDVSASKLGMTLLMSTPVAMVGEWMKKTGSEGQVF